MKVRCVKVVHLAGALAGVERPDTESVRRGGEYVVLSIMADPKGGQGVWFQILGERGRAHLWPADMFEPISGTIPSSWRISLDDDGGLDIAPESWLRPGFWDEKETPPRNAANDIFDEEVERMLAEEA